MNGSYSTVCMCHICSIAEHVCRVRSTAATPYFLVPKEAFSRWFSRCGWLKREGASEREIERERERERKTERQTDTQDREFETSGRQQGDSGETAGRARGDSVETAGRQRGWVGPGHVRGIQQNRNPKP